jgi:hypothetical protein
VISILHWVGNISTFSGFIPLILLFVWIRKLDKRLKAVLFLAVLSLVSDGLGFFIVHTPSETELRWEIYTYLEFLGIILIYHRAFESLRAKRFLFLLLIVFTILQIGYLYSDKWEPVCSATSSALVSMICVYYFYKIFSELKIPVLTTNVFFWINSGLLVYSLSTFLMGLFLNYMRHSEEKIILVLWSITSFANFAKNIIFTVGICQMRKV